MQGIGRTSANPLGATPSGVYPMIARILFEATRKALTRSHETQAPREDVPDCDTTWMPVKLKLPSRLRSMPDPLVTAHVTDVEGGFGVAKSAIKRWQRIVDAGKQAPSADVRESALLERYSGCAYHWIASRAVGSVRNHPAQLRTSHGNGGNRGMGWAIDCGSKEALSPALVQAGHRSLAGCIFECHEASGEIVSVVPHRAFSKQRLGDTSGIVWGAVVLPVVAALGPTVCRIDYDLAEGGGRPVPRSWDPSATHDDKGRRI